MTIKVLRATVLPLALSIGAGVLLGGALAPVPAAAVIYCTGPGLPVGCVVRRPVRAAVYCTAPGRPVGCVGRPGVAAPRVVVTPRVGVGAPGVRRGVNTGGPVNRVGVR